MSKHYYGNGKPVNVYRNQEKLAGYHTETQSGDSVSFDDTYNDTADVELTGNTVQASDYYAKDGLSSQVQTVQGKNLIDKSRLQVREVGGDSISGSYTVTDGVITYTALNGSFGIIITTVQVSKNTNYSASLVATVLSGSISSSNGVRIHFVNTNTYTSVVPNSRSTSFNSGENTLIDIMFYVGFPTTLDGVVELKNFQLELGSSATSYTPFVPNSPSPEYPSPITSNLPAGTYKTTCADGIYEFTLAEELRGIGSNVDKVVFDRKSHRGILERRIVKTTLNGTETFVQSGTVPDGNNAIRFSCVKPSIAYGLNDEVVRVMSDKLKGVKHASLWLGLEGVSIENGSNSISIRCNAIKNMTVNEVKNWLSSNNITCYCWLATPTRTPLTFTKVSSSSAPECPMTFLTNTPSLNYPADVTDAVGNLISRGKNLFDKSKIFNDFYLISNGTLGFNNLWCYTDYIPVLPNTSYIAWGYSNPGSNPSVVFYDSDKNYISGNAHLGHAPTFIVTPSNCKYLRNSSLKNDINSIQLEIGSAPTAYEPFKGYTTIPFPPLRKIGEVADSYIPKTGQKINRISDWVNFSSLTEFRNDPDKNGYKRLYIMASLLPNSIASYTNFLADVYKYDSTPIAKIAYGMAADQFYLGGNALQLTVSDIDSGMGETVIPTSAEWKAYFYGWKMYNQDGTTPYYKSEVPYNPSTWAEWTKDGGATADSTGAVFTSTGAGVVGIEMPTAIKTSTKYGVLYNIVSTNINGDLGIGGGARIGRLGIGTKNLGNNKIFGTSLATITNNSMIIYIDSGSTAGTSIKIKDISIFELPTGSQIEADFNNLTADQLAAKYTFNGLCPKNWKHIVGNQADIDASKTAVLPTASYAGYTPYKMLYQLATPVEEQYTPTPVPTHLGQTSIETDSVVKPTINATAKVPD